MTHSSEILRANRRIELKNGVPRYKFMKFEYLNSTAGSQIFVSNPSSFNDPYDLRISIEDLTYRGPFDDKERLQRAFGELFNKNPEVENFWIYDGLAPVLQAWIDGSIGTYQLIEKFYGAIRKFGVVCFAQDWDLPLMWSHYAGSHSEICLEYIVRPMSFALSQRNLHWNQHAVQYVSELPKICISELLFAPHQVLAKILSTKHVDWAYEK